MKETQPNKKQRMAIRKNFKGDKLFGVEEQEWGSQADIQSQSSFQSNLSEN